MHKKWLKKSAVLLLAGAMIFSNLNVYAQNSVEPQGTEQQAEGEIVQPNETTETPKFFVPVHGRDEIGVGGTELNLFTLCNMGTETVSSKDFEIKIELTEGAGDVQMNLVPYEEFELEPGDEWNGQTIFYELTVPADCTAKVIKYKVQIYKKADSSLVYESEEESIYPYTIQNKVLKYNDSSKGEKYKLELELDENLKFEGLVAGGTGDATEIWHTSFEDMECYLRPEHPSSVVIQPAEGYTLGEMELIPADAGTISHPLGQSMIIDVDLHAPAVLRVKSTTECVLDGGNGFKISAPASEDNASLFTGYELLVEEYTDEAKLAELKEVFDSFAKVKGYTLNMHCFAVDENPPMPEGKLTVTMPIPEGWDASRTVVYYMNDGGMGSMSGKVSEDGKYISFNTESFSTESIITYVLMEHSIPAEVKDWDRVAADYINDARLVNWMTNTQWEARFYEETPSADDAAIISMVNSWEKYDRDSHYYNTEKHRFEIPYDEFAENAKEFFRNVPNMKAVKNDFLFYDADMNAMVVPDGGVGDAPLVTEVEEVTELGNSVYAVRFKLSHDTVLDNPDMTDESQYRTCTLVVEANEKGNWRYVSFLEGYPEIKPEEPEIPETPETPEEPENPEQPENPEEPENPEQPETPEEPETPEVPSEGGNELSKEEIREVVDRIANAEQSGAIIVSMDKATVVPKEILKAAKGKDIDVILEMDGYSWTINGNNITASNLKDINLEVKENVNAVPADTVKKLAGSNPSKQITLAHNGEFGFKAELKIYVGTQYAGQYGNLFWYTEDKDIEFMNNSKIDAEGYASFTFSHASDYVVVVSKKAMSEKDIPKELQKDSDNKKPADKNTSGTASTGDTTNVTMYIVLFGCALTAIGVLGRKKLNRR